MTTTKLDEQIEHWMAKAIETRNNSWLVAAGIAMGLKLAQDILADTTIKPEEKDRQGRELQ